MLQQTGEVDVVLKKMASEAVVQRENLRVNVRDLTTRALQAREVSLAAIKQVLKSVTEGVNVGAAKVGIDVEKPLADALAGMDDALQKAVHASQMALERLFDHGADFEDSRIRKALAELDKLEDEFLKIVRQSAAGANQQVKAQWAGVLAHLPAGGTGAGAKAEAAATRFGEQMRTAVREQREGAAKMTHMLAKNYGTLASGILIGMSEGLLSGGAKPKATKTTKATPAAKSTKAKNAKARKTKTRKAARA
jgi:hypothetical protein